MKLYHYVHCPFCVRVRMACGFLGILYESIVLPYNDEETPIKLMGVKMLPIFDFETSISNESLDIIKRLDSHNTLNNELFTSEFDLLLNEIGSNVHSLAMPYWIWTPEFDEKSRNYFQEKKEIKRGPFKDLVFKSSSFIKDLNKTLEKLESNISPYYNNDKLTILDIALASHLWGMYIVPEFQFSDKLHQYLQKVKNECHFNYHIDFWK